MKRGRKADGLAEIIAKTQQVGDCWIFQSSHERYAATTGGEGVHRKVYRLIHGPIPSGLFVCHRCDTPKCVRPDHLFLGTPKENSQDSIRKGRFTMLSLRGEQKWHKLTDVQITEIRHRLSAGETQTSIAKLFGVTQSHISRIASNELRKVG